MEKIDLKNLSSEISARKREKKETAVKLGESGRAAMPSDQFLNGLWHAKESGVPNAATNTLKNKIDITEGKTPSRQIDNLDLMQHVDNTRQPIQQRPVVERQMPVTEAPDRDDLLYAEFERKKRELYENFPTIYKNPPQQQQQPARTGQVLNEEVILDVKRDVIGYIKENFAPIVEEAMKDAIMEMYAVERIKQVINENNDIIEKIVIDTIRKIQERNKQKKQ